MDSKTYAQQLERKLIEQFKQTFQEKLGYEPLVLTKVQLDTDGYLPILSLETLQEMFEPFLPLKYDKKISLVSKHRYREVVELRNVYCYLARMMGYSLIVIGQSLGNRDHTTVIHNVTCFKNLMETNDPFRQKYQAILTYIKQEHESSVMAKSDQVQCEPEPALLP